MFIRENTVYILEKDVLELNPEEHLLKLSWLWNLLLSIDTNGFLFVRWELDIFLKCLKPNNVQVFELVCYGPLYQMFFLGLQKHQQEIHHYQV